MAPCQADKDFLLKFEADQEEQPNNPTTLNNPKLSGPLSTLEFYQLHPLTGESLKATDHPQRLQSLNPV